jgi:hypothetical protein
MVAVGCTGFLLVASAHEEKAPKDKKQQEKKAGAQATTAQSAPASKPAEETPTMITNEVLERMYGKSEPAPPKEDGAEKSGEPAKELDPLQAMEQEKELAAKRQADMAVAQQKLADAQARVTELEKRVLEYKNPYLPRPQLTPEEAAKQQGLNQAERVTATQKELEEARKAVAQAQAGLDKARSGS